MFNLVVLKNENSTTLSIIFYRFLDYIKIQIILKSQNCMYSEYDFTFYYIKITKLKLSRSTK